MDWIAISLLPGVGPATLKKLHDGGWTPQRLLASDSDPSSPNLSTAQTDALNRYNTRQGAIYDEVKRIEQYLESSGTQLIFAGDADYPALLHSSPQAPAFLFVKGSVDALHLPSVAIVGSRKASAAGLRHAYQFGKALCAGGFVVSSGLALGIDGAAHQAAVDLSKPTVAVMGTGPNRCYPARHKRLAQDILDNGGALVTELLPDKGPLAAHFPRRNRIITGLATGVLVVEAAIKSGSLITARLALEEGREVFAIPGPIDAPGSRGCHQLIREGATLTESVTDILAELPAMLASYQEPDTLAEATVLPEDDQQAALLEQIEYATTYLEQLQIALGWDVGQLQQHLMQLELAGWVEAAEGGYRRIR